MIQLHVSFSVCYAVIRFAFIMLCCIVVSLCVCNVMLSCVSLSVFYIVRFHFVYAILLCFTFGKFCRYISPGYSLEYPDFYSRWKWLFMCLLASQNGT